MPRLSFPPECSCEKPAERGSSARRGGCGRSAVLPHHEALPGPGPDHELDRVVGFVKDTHVELMRDREASERISWVGCVVQADNVLAAIVPDG